MIELIRNIFLSNSILFIVVLITIVTDFITGITKAIFNKNIQSEKLRKTIPKIIGYFSIILISVILQIVFNIDFIVKIMCMFIVVIESLSIIENISNFVSIPSFLLSFLENKKTELDNTDIKK